MNYYDCAVLCKNTELNLTLADQGVLMGTGSFANNCQIAGCRVMGTGTEIVNVIPNTGGIPIHLIYTAHLFGATLIMVGIALLVLWQWRRNKK